jgi:hypothetical protein
VGGSVFVVECIPIVVSVCGRCGIVDIARCMHVHCVLVWMHMIKNMGCGFGCMTDRCSVQN